MRKLYNIGFDSGGKYKKTINGKSTKAYVRYHKLFTRCYCPKYQAKKPTYIDCEVHPDWYDFQVFAEWYEVNYIEGFHIDKDILVPGNKIYGPNTCCFVPNVINSLLCDSASARGLLPVGVTFNKRDQNYRVQIKMRGVQTYIGYFDNINDASEAYKNAKEQYVKDMALEWQDRIKPEVFDALINWRVLND